MSSEMMDKIISIVFVSLLFIAVGYVVYAYITDRLYVREDNSIEHGDERIILVVNKSINEWKRIYRDYIVYSDRKIREDHVVYGEYNITELLSIIDNANSSSITRKFYFYDPIIKKYVVLEIVIPLFIVELHEKNMPEYGTEPMIKAVAEALRKYVEEYPSNYTEYRLALMVLKIASQIHYKWEPKSYDLLLEIVYDQGNCDSKTWLAIELAANVGLWSADLIAYKCEANGFPTDHGYVAIAIDNPPPRLKGYFNFTWMNHTFYIAEVAVNGGSPKFPIKPYPCSIVENIIGPYWKKHYFINKPLW